MSFLLNKELKTIKQREHDYLTQKHQVDVSFDETKTKARHIMGNPETLAAIFTAGAFKGAKTDSPKSKRNQAVTSLIRTAVISFIQ